MQHPNAAPAYEFGPYRFEPAESRLFCRGRPVPLPPKALETLLALVERRGCLVRHRELVDRVWGNRFVEENSLTKSISTLRKALGDRRAVAEYIETVAKRGYRFVAPVRRDDGAEIASAAADPHRRRPADAHTFRLCSEARCHVLRYTSSGWRLGAARYEQAIARDPGYAQAHAELAIAATLACVYFTDAPEVQERAREAARRAAALDPELAAAHIASALVAYLADWNWEEAEASFQRALALDPELAWGHDYYGLFLALTGRPREALPSLERAVELSPVRLTVKGDLGLFHHLTGGTEQALAHQRRALELDPYCPLTRVEHARAWEAAGAYARAAAEIGRTLRLDDAPWVRLWLGRAWALAGRRAEARRVLAAVRREESKAPLSPVFPALLHAALGERAAALTLLEEACARRTPWMAFLALEPAFAELRGAPRFRALLRRAGLAAP